MSAYQLKQNGQKFLIAVFRFGLLIGLSYIILYTIILKLSVSFMSAEDLIDFSVKWVPKYWTLENYRIAADMMGFWKNLLITLSISTAGMLIQTFFCTLAGYGFARFDFKGKSLIFLFVILTLIIPPQTYMVASYTQLLYFDIFGIGSLFGMRPVNLINTPLPLFLLSLGCVATKNGLYIYVMRQFFAKLPKEIEEAAEVDGAGVFRIFFNVMLPNARPAIITVLVLSFIWIYNDLYMATTYMPEVQMFSTVLSTLPYVFKSAISGPGAATVEVSVISNAGAILTLIPIILIFCIVQRMFVEGVERTGITG
ncbi:MAG: carbohydrate ABC transporter permease [Clostridiaceae bacterium]|nr:carbohydrate ABC transporter permease [Clostridiaceae bacterium]